MADDDAGAAPRVTAAPGFTGWLSENDCSLIVSTYQTRKIITIGVDDDDRLVLTPRTRLAFFVAVPVGHGHLILSAHGRLIRAGPLGGEQNDGVAGRFASADEA